MITIRARRGEVKCTLDIDWPAVMRTSVGTSTLTPRTIFIRRANKYHLAKRTRPTRFARVYTTKRGRICTYDGDRAKFLARPRHKHASTIIMLRYENHLKTIQILFRQIWATFSVCCRTRRNGSEGKQRIFLMESRVLKNVRLKSSKRDVEMCAAIENPRQVRAVIRFFYGKTSSYSSGTLCRVRTKCDEWRSCSWMGSFV